MSKFIGRLVDIGLGKEASRGGGVAPSFWLPKATENIKDAVLKARSRLNYGTIDGPGNVAPVAKKWAEGSIETDLFTGPFGLILLNLLGTVSSAANGDSTYTHTYSLQNDSQHDSLAICVKDPDRDLMHKNAMINSLTLTIVPVEVVKIVFDILGLSHNTTSQTASYSAVGNKFLGRHLSLKIAANTAALAAASEIKPKRLVLTINQNVMKDDNAGTVQASDMLNQFIEISGELELNLEDDTYRDYMLNGDYKAMRIQLTNSEVTIGSGSQNPDFKIDLSRVDFEAWEPIRAIDEIAKQTVNFHALYDLTNGNVVNDCELTNVVASY